MRGYFLSFVFVMCSLGLFAQSSLTADNVKIGTIYQIGKPSTNTYKYINFPRPNMIIKGGGIVNYQNVKSNIVLVTSINKKKDGTTIVKIKRKDGKRFFGSHKVITVDLTGALQSEELLAI